MVNRAVSGFGAGMTAREAFLAGKAALSAAQIESAAFDARWLLAFCTGLQPSRLFFDDGVIDCDSLARFETLIKRRAAHEPLQYLLGEWEFHSMLFETGPGVLIPRPETELLVEEALALAGHRQNPCVLDLCTGSGCIAAALAKERADASVTAVDWFDAPLALAERNFARFKLTNITLLRADALQNPPPQLLSQFDLLLSNPPYIRSEEIGSLDSEVQKEPREALDGGRDGLLFYRAIAERWTGVLKAGGCVAVEIGFDQAQDVCEIFERKGYRDVQVKKDYSGNERVIIGTVGD